MRKLLLIPVLLATTWALAQSDQTAPMGKGKANQTSVQGCLGGSDGNYTLTDKTGNTYQLTAGSADLKSHVGQQVQISGSTNPPPGDTTATGVAGTSGTSGTAGTGSSSSASQANQITVDSVSKISDSCSPSR
jgi:hypothetical protein